jgi:hypothetical protein
MGTAAAVTLGSASAASAAGEPVMALDQVRPGMECSVRSVLKGTRIESFSARVVDVVSGSLTGDGPRILVRVSGPAIDATGIGPGFSGSPVSCPGDDGVQRIAGAISEGVGEEANRLVLARPIEAILAEPAAPRPQRALKLRGLRPLAGAWSVSGAPQWLASAVQEGARRAGRMVYAAPAAPLRAFAPVSLEPGAAMVASLATGDLALGAVGTVAYRDGDRVWGFGHALEAAGARSLMLQDAYVYDIVDMPGFIGGSYKLAAPGHVLGTLTEDRPQAVVGSLGRSPRAIPLQVIARDADRGTTKVLRVDVADETALDDPSGMSPLRLVGGIATAQAAGGALDGGPAGQTATVCVRIDVRGVRAPLGFCTRHITRAGMPGTLAGDVDEALALLEGNTFARLPVRAVTVRMTLSRGLHQATLVSARAPKVARPGERVRVRATVRRFRGGPESVTFDVRVPRSARPGPTSLVLRGQEEETMSAEESLVALFGRALGESDPDQQPASMASLVRRIDALRRFDGLTAKLGSRPLGPVYRSPTLRITGKLAIPIRIAD